MHFLAHAKKGVDNPRLTLIVITQDKTKNLVKPRGKTPVPEIGINIKSMKKVVEYIGIFRQY